MWAWSELEKASHIQRPILQIRDLSPKVHLAEVNLIHPASWLAQRLPTWPVTSPRLSAPLGHQVVLTDVVQGACAKAPVELLGAKSPKVMDGEGPQVEHIVARELGALFHQHHSGPQQCQLHSSPQTTRSSAHHQAL